MGVQEWMGEPAERYDPPGFGACVPTDSGETEGGEARCWAPAGPLPALKEA